MWYSSRKADTLNSDDITDSFGPVIHDIEHETDAIEDAVFVARDEDFSVMLKQIGTCRKKVMGLMRLLGGKADVIKGFAKKCNENYLVTPRGDIGLYLGDIQGSFRIFQRIFCVIFANHKIHHQITSLL